MELWCGVINAASMLGEGFGFCIFSSYSSPLMGAPQHHYPESIAPLMSSASQRASTMLSSDEESPDVCLFLQRDEYNDVVERYCRMKKFEFTLQKDLQDYLFLMTNGHPRMVATILSFLYRLNAKPE